MSFGEHINISVAYTPRCRWVQFPKVAFPFYTPISSSWVFCCCFSTYVSISSWRDKHSYYINIVGFSTKMRRSNLQLWAKGAWISKIQHWMEEARHKRIQFHFHRCKRGNNELYCLTTASQFIFEQFLLEGGVKGAFRTYESNNILFLDLGDDLETWTFCKIQQTTHWHRLFSWCFILQ